MVVELEQSGAGQRPQGKGGEPTNKREGKNRKRFGGGTRRSCGGSSWKGPWPTVNTIAIKPDGVQCNFVGEIIKRFKQKGFCLTAMKLIQASEDLLKEHYIDLKDRPFFAGLVKYMQSGPVVAMVLEGLNVVKTGLVMLGETNPVDSKPGTIRGDFCIQVDRNIIHGSESVESAEKEIGLWIQPEELVDYKSCAKNWIYGEKKRKKNWIYERQVMREQTSVLCPFHSLSLL
ncbi:nucleoside diphosphate kinase A-like [Lycaon pictus]